MAKGRIHISGVDDKYLGATLEDIEVDLKFLIEKTREAIHELEELYKEVGENEDTFDNPYLIFLYTSSCIRQFKNYESEYSRIVKEIKTEVKQSHIDVLTRIYKSSDIGDRILNNGFREDHFYRVKDETKHWIVADIYKKSGDLWVLNFDLSELKTQLQTFIGNRIRSTGESSSTKKDEKVFINPINVPEGTTYKDIDISIISERGIHIRIKNNKTEPRDFHELGFKHKLSEKPKKAWGTLLKLANGKGEILFKDLPREEHNILRTRIKELNAWFRDYFGLEENAVHRYNPHLKGYRSKFHISFSPQYIKSKKENTDSSEFKKDIDETSLKQYKQCRETIDWAHYEEVKGREPQDR